MDRLVETVKSKLVSNYLYLLFVQLFGVALPLILIPFLIRTIGIDLFGELAIAIALFAIVGITIDFGFNYEGVRLISKSKFEKTEIQLVYGVISQFKLMIIIFYSLVLSCVFFFHLLENLNPLVYVFTFVTVCFQSMNPVWFHQGLEDMRFIAICDCIAKLCSFLLIIVFVNSSDDYILVPLFQMVGQLVSCLISNVRCWFTHNVFFKWYRFSDIAKFASNSVNLFLTNASTVLYTNITTLLLGYLAGPASVGLFQMVDKLITGLKMMAAPMLQALLPRATLLAEASDINLRRFLKKISVLPVVLSVFVVAVLAIYASELLMVLYGKDGLEVVDILHILIIVPVLVVLDTLFGTLFLIPLNKSNEYRTVVLCGGLVSLIMMFILIPLYGVFGAAAAVVTTEIIITAWFMTKFLRYKGVTCGN